MWKDLDHQIFANFKSAGLLSSEQKFLVGLSGGADSVAALILLKNFGLSVCAHHCHHGPGQNENYRNQALHFCEELCRELKIPFSFEKASVHLDSEESLRDFRRESLVKHQRQLGENVCLVLGHHQDDQLETQLMRLIRGTGHQGLVSMTFQSEGQILRPLLRVSKGKIIQYLQDHGKAWLEDPSNQDKDPLRNWIRHEWLPSLEAKQAGATGSLARSLQLLSDEWVSKNEKSVFQQGFQPESASISLLFYLSLSAERQQSLLAEWVFTLGIRDFSLGKIKEVQKRLDSPEKEHMFTVGGLEWIVNAGQIKVRF